MKKILCLIISAIMLFSLAGCQGNNEDINNSETDDKVQGVDTMHIKDLAKPETVVYVVDGTEKVFSASDEKFDRILELNAARDTVDTDGIRQIKPHAVQRDSLLLALEKDFLEHGRYLVYRYSENSFGELIFSLPKESELKDSGDCWVVERGNGGGPYVSLSAADDLIEYIEAE